MGGGDEEEMAPSTLEQKLALLKLKESITVDEIRGVTLDDKWLGRPNLPEGWHYTFEDIVAAPKTSEISDRVNMEKITEICRG